MKPRCPCLYITRPPVSDYYRFWYVTGVVKATDTNGNRMPKVMLPGARRQGERTEYTTN